MGSGACIKSKSLKPGQTGEKTLPRRALEILAGINRMSTKLTVSLICAAGALYAFVPMIGSLVTLGFLACAVRREQTTDDKSEHVSPLIAGLVFSGIGLWVAFSFFRELH